MKTKTSKLIILMIALFAVMLIGTTKVNASWGIITSGTPTKQSLDNIPDTMEVDVKEVETEKAEQIIYNQVVEILKNKGITVKDSNGQTGAKKGEYTINISVNGNTADIELDYAPEDYSSSLIARKEITIKYNNSSTYNESDKQYVENIIKKLGFKKDDGIYSISLNYYTDITNNNKIEGNTIDEIVKKLQSFGIVVQDEGAAGSATWEKLICDLYRNDIAYEQVIISEYGYYQVTIPNTIEEANIPLYIKEKVEEARAKNEILAKIVSQVQKVEKAEDNFYNMYYSYLDYQGNIKNASEPLKIRIRKETKPTTNTSAVTKTDSTTNVKLNAPVGTVPSNTVLEVKAVKEGTTYNTVKNALATMKNFAVYDITLKSNGVTVQPNGNVKISVPVPSDYNKENLTVYRIEDNGNKTEYKVTVEGNYATFETDHFSTYVLAEKKAETKPATSTSATTNKGEKDNTPKTGTVESITYIIPVVIISSLGVVTFRKKETK